MSVLSFLLSILFVGIAIADIKLHWFLKFPWCRCCKSSAERSGPVIHSPIAPFHSHFVESSSSSSSSQPSMQTSMQSMARFDSHEKRGLLEDSSDSLPSREVPEAASSDSEGEDRPSEALDLFRAI